MPRLLVRCTTVAALLMVTLPPAAGRTRTGPGARKRIPATFYVDPTGLRSLGVRSVVVATEHALSARDELGFTPVNQLLQPERKQLEVLSRAKQRAGRGRTLITNLEVSAGVQELRRAAELQERVFHLLADSPEGVRQHADLLAALATGLFLAGQGEEARETLQRAMVLDPELKYDRKRFPPQMKKLFFEVHFLVDELGTGGLRIRTRPPRAEVRINGKLAGYSPVTNQGLTAGPNLVTLTRVGYRTKTVRIKVEGAGHTVRQTVRLEALEGRPGTLLRSCLQEAASRVAGPKLATAATGLRRDVLFLGTVRSRGEFVTLTLYAYDHRRRQVSSRATVTVSAADPDQDIAATVASLMPFLSRPAPSKPPADAGPSWFARFRSSPYFWPVVGVAGALVVGGAVGVGYYFGTRGSSSARNVVILPARAGGLR